MKKRIILGLALSILISTYFVSASVYFSSPQPLYNLGDLIDIEITVDPILEGFLLKVDLFCEEMEVINFNNLPNEEGKVNIKLPLNFYTIKGFNGDCYFLGEYGKEEQKSRGFQISKSLDVFLNTESFFANPGEEIIVNGVAKKLNGDLVNGDVEITIPLLRVIRDEDSEEIDTEKNESDEGEETEEEQEEIIVERGVFNGKVENGEFSVIISLAENIRVGDYRVDVYVFEEVADMKTSEEVVIANIKVFQVLTSVDIALNNQNIDPGQTFVFKPALKDQAGMPFDEEVSVLIKNEWTNRIFEKIVQSEESVEYKIPTDLAAGYYDLEAASGEISTIKKFYVNEKELISFEIKEGNLIVTNLGNVPYKKNIQIDLNGNPFVKKVDLKVGELQTFKLTGSEGEYEVKVTDGKTEILEKGVALTGKAINVKELKSGSLIFKTPILWIFLVIILGGGFLFLFKNTLKKKSFAYPIKDKLKRLKSAKKDKKEHVKQEDEKKTVKGGALVAPSEAEQVLVLKGNKNNASVIALKIKNKIGKNEKLILEKAVEPVYEKRGAVYEQGDYIIMIFSPLMTRKTKNEVEAARLAEKIALVLKEYNKKSKEKIEFGIGISSGGVINKIEDKKLKFTALGSFITVAKRLASASNEQILVTKQAYENGISEIKAEKKKIGNGDIYEVRRVIDYEKNQKFIRDFLDRMDKEENKNKNR